MIKVKGNAVGFWTRVKLFLSLNAPSRRAKRLYRTRVCDGFCDYKKIK